MKKKISKKNRKKYDSNQILTLIQIIFCIIFVASILAIKSLNPSIYESLKLWYLDKVNDSIIVSDRTLETPDDNALFVNNNK